VPPLSEEAFGELYRAVARPLWTYVYRVTSNVADADDIVQDAFCRLLQADVRSLTDDELRRYLFRVAGNLVTDRWRRLTREQARSHYERERVIEPALPHDDVTKTFGRLKPRERALLWLAYVEHESHTEIADSLGVKRDSVKVLLARARAHLRDLLASMERERK
jgi:RNA polymerase sigma-70 factor, ECF subfamily